VVEHNRFEILSVVTFGSRQSSPPNAFAQANCPPVGNTVRPGITMYDVTDAERASMMRVVRSHFEQVSRHSIAPPFQCPVEFEIHDWMRSDLLDGAVLSLMLALLLKRQVGAEVVAEFPERGMPSDGYAPVVSATRDGKPRAEPATDLELLLCNFVQEAAGADSDAKCDRKIDISKVKIGATSHLSTSSFVMPVLYAESWGKRRHVPDALLARVLHRFVEALRIRFDESELIRLRASSASARLRAKA
jgi:hypothetical protein